MDTISTGFDVFADVDRGGKRGVVFLEPKIPNLFGYRYPSGAKRPHFPGAPIQGGGVMLAAIGRREVETLLRALEEATEQLRTALTAADSALVQP
ncbi:MAG: hypothetical protein ACLPJH_16955 [Myxococcaceae bacterium]